MLRSKDMPLQNHLDAVILALDTDEIAEDQIKVLRKAVNEYNQRQLRRAFAAMGETFARIGQAIAKPDQRAE